MIRSSALAAHIVFVASQFMVSGSSVAKTAAELEQWCVELSEPSESPDTDAFSKAMLCSGYFDGYLDALALSKFQGVDNNLCIPANGISLDQASRIFMGFLDRHPEDLGQTARTIVYLALVEAFPCK